MTKQVTQGRVAGSVVSADGRPVADAVVALYVVSDAFYESADTALVLSRSNEHGEFTAAVPAGRYTISATAQGYTAARGAITVAIDAPASVSLRMGADAGMKVHGQVTDRERRALAGVRVRATAYTFPDKLLYYALSDASGRYELQLPRQDGYLVAVEPGEYASFDKLSAKAPDSVVDLVGHPRRETLAPAPPAVLSWVQRSAVPLRGCAPTNEVGDLAPLGAAVGRARVIAIGEATHGTREIFQLKHRLLQYAVSELGVSAFLMEADFAEALEMNDYVLNGQGDVRAILPTLRGPLFNTEEYLALFEWMRAYNADPAHTHKLRFYGVDVQSTPLASRRIVQFVARTAPAQQADIESSLTAFATRPAFRQYRHADRATQEAAKRQARHVLQWFDDNRDLLVQKSSAAEWRTVERLAWIVSKAAEVFGPPDDLLDQVVRDRAMADNVEWILATEGKDARVVLSAHNGHIARGDYQGVERTGGVLARRLGDAYYAIGTSFYEGGFRAYDGEPEAKSKGIVDCTVPPPPADFIEATLAQAAPTPFFLDLKAKTRPPEVARWLAVPRSMRTYGAVFSGTERTIWPIAVWPDQLDGVFMVRRTAPARALPSPPH